MSIQALHLDNDRRLVTIVMWLMLVPVIWNLRTDFALYASDWPHLRSRLLVRGTLVAICLSGIALMRSTQTRAAYQRIILGLSLAVAMFIFMINALRPQGSTLPLRTPLLNIFMLYAALPNTFARQVIAPLLLTTGLIVLRLFWVTSGADGDIPGDILILVVLNVVGLVLVHRRLELEESAHEAWFNEHAAKIEARKVLSELQTLQGIIPICSHCRLVRSDHGEWQRVERYVAEHSQAQFSHGICPSCVSEHYPEWGLEAS